MSIASTLGSLMDEALMVTTEAIYPLSLDGAIAIYAVIGLFYALMMIGEGRKSALNQGLKEGTNDALDNLGYTLLLCLFAWWFILFYQITSLKERMTSMGFKDIIVSPYTAIISVFGHRMWSYDIKKPWRALRNSAKRASEK